MCLISRPVLQREDARTISSSAIRHIEERVILPHPPLPGRIWQGEDASRPRIWELIGRMAPIHRAAKDLRLIPEMPKTSIFRGVPNDENDL